MTYRQLEAHCLAALAYGSWLLFCLTVAVVAPGYRQYRDEQTQRWILEIEFWGMRSDAFAFFTMLAFVCVVLPLIIAILIAAFRPIAALETQAAMIGHGVSLGCAIPVFFLLFLLLSWSGLGH
jgi:hypothetical protein